MEYMSLNIEELNKLLKTNKLTKNDLIKESIAKSKELQKKSNVFVSILDDAKPLLEDNKNNNADINNKDKVNKDNKDNKDKDNKDNKEINNILSGIPYGVSDVFSTKDILTTGSSEALKDYIPFFNATVIDKLNQLGAILINKTICSEFGIEGNKKEEQTKEDNEISALAYAVKENVYPFVLGTDAGGFLRKSAAYYGIVGYKPTYGMISRYGVLPFTSSLDHVAVLTRKVQDVAIVVDNIKGKDKNDMTTWDSSEINLIKSLNGNIKDKKLCYIKEICDISEYENLNLNVNEKLKKELSEFKNKINILRENDISIEEVSINQVLLNLIEPTFDIISSAEVTSNTSNLTGLVFGPRGDGDNYVDIIRNYRTKNFSSLTKKRLTIGSYFLQSNNKDKYFRNAQRVRRLLVDNLKEIFKKYDAIILPVGININEYLKLANFGGFPSITIPVNLEKEKINKKENKNIEEKNKVIALNITGNCNNDENILNIAYGIESIFNNKKKNKEEKEK